VSAAAEAGFEVLRFAGQPASAESALVELEGRFPAGPPRRPPRLVVEGAPEPIECPPAVASSHGDGTWRATFAVPLELLESGAYALAADGVLVDLPRPDVEAVDGDADRLVRVAREANDLRRRLDAAPEGRAEAEARAERAEAELGVERTERAAAEQARDAEAATVAELRAELEAERERLSSTEAALREELQADRERTDAEIQGLREQLDAAVAERERLLEAERLERETALGREQERAARELEEAVAAERARANQISHELRAARAENEAMRREGPLPRRVPQPADEPTDGEEATEKTMPIAKRRELNRHATASDGPTAVFDEPPGSPAPGAAAAGARQIEPVPGSEELPIARILAVGALALAVIIVLLLLVKL
jgi:hypothetical protein